MGIYEITENYRLIFETSIEQYRCESFFTKEPETIQWIATAMRNSEVLYDVGANIGVYSLYAASLYPEMMVYGFEPFVGNYLRFCENVRLNGFANVIPLYLALSDESGIETFYLKDDTVGSSGHQLGQNVDEWGNEFEILGVHHVLCDTLDDFIAHYGLRKPTHIKIDVDGAEGKIVRGMSRTIQDAGLKSVLIEVNHTSTDRDEVVRLFMENGFTIDNEFNKAEKHSRNRRKGTVYEDTENIIFTRF